ncbi:MAG: hypothetical protein RR327_05795 [Clostridia bacterium]
MAQILVCPQCGQKLCKAENGSKMTIQCSKCKSEFALSVEPDGAILIQPIEKKNVNCKKS